MPANNPFKYNAAGPDSPALAVVSITPSDATDQPRVLRDIRVGGSGNVSVVDTEGNESVFVGCQPGERLGPFFLARIKSTGTTATNLLGYV